MRSSSRERAGAAQIDADERVPAAERVAEAVPERARETEAVHEHDRRPVALHLDVELRAVDVEQLLGRAASSPPVVVVPSISPPISRALTASTIAATVGA